MNDEDKQGWDKIEEQERENQKKRDFSKVGSGCLFSFEVIVGIILVILILLGVYFWLFG